mmetsp:Transcript_31375/g.61976  ORF Transcript_31375/g.61976 Transcript_31375/m.61976 type:complete len:228 (-) Transcript_31375:822-1505(-)
MGRSEAGGLRSLLYVACFFPFPLFFFFLSRQGVELRTHSSCCALGRGDRREEGGGCFARVRSTFTVSVHSCVYVWFLLRWKGVSADVLFAYVFIALCCLQVLVPFLETPCVQFWQQEVTTPVVPLFVPQQEETTVAIVSEHPESNRKRKEERSRRCVHLFLSSFLEGKRTEQSLSAQWNDLNVPTIFVLVLECVSLSLSPPSSFPPFPPPFSLSGCVWCCFDASSCL